MIMIFFIADVFPVKNGNYHFFGKFVITLASRSTFGLRLGSVIIFGSKSSSSDPGKAGTLLSRGLRLSSFISATLSLFTKDNLVIKNSKIKVI